jgi:sulfoxide reductase catalytic subunit YedY
VKKIPSSEITPEDDYYSRRRFLKNAVWLAAAAALSACTPPQTAAPTGTTPPPVSTQKDEFGAPVTDFQSITNYNNFYEFTGSKSEPAVLAQKMVLSPWQVQVGGLVKKPKTFDIDDLRKKFDQEERIYRLRCVEGWSMVIPWQGFPLSRLLKEVEPDSAAKFVRFESVFDPANLPRQNSTSYPWPYVEGLAIDEAMHDLTLLSTGLYGKSLLPQNGAPIRLVVPWKYGFKSIKSIVKIDLVAAMPDTFWVHASPDEYGFYANVNPKVPHPRWPQSTERRIGETARITTRLFNGYAQVAPMYDGMIQAEW